MSDKENLFYSLWVALYDLPMIAGLPLEDGEALIVTSKEGCRYRITIADYPFDFSVLPGASEPEGTSTVHQSTPDA